MQQHAFTLHEDAWVRDSQVFASGPAVGYRVGGMPDGTTARIANFAAPNGNDWRIMRMDTHDSQSGWSGHYNSAEDALEALRQSVQ